MGGDEMGDGRWGGGGWLLQGSDQRPGCAGANELLRVVMNQN